MTRAEMLVERLHEFYGVLPAPPGDPFAFFVWEVLGARTTPRKREAAVAALRRIPALTPDAMWRAPQGPLEASVRSAGPHLEQRLQALRAGVDVFRRRRGLPTVIQGSFLSARRALSSLPELGEAGAHRMLLFTAEHPVLPVDAAIVRLGLRLGYGTPGGSSRQQARSVRRAVAKEVPRSVAARRHVAIYLAHHAAATCTEAGPHCSVCPILEECPYGRRQLA